MQDIVEGLSWHVTAFHPALQTEWLSGPQARGSGVGGSGETEEQGPLLTKNLAQLPRNLVPRDYQPPAQPRIFFRSPLQANQPGSCTLCLCPPYPLGAAYGQAQLIQQGA